MAVTLVVNHTLQCDKLLCACHIYFADAAQLVKQQSLTLLVKQRLH